MDKYYLNFIINTCEYRPAVAKAEILSLNFDKLKITLRGRLNI